MAYLRQAQTAVFLLNLVANNLLSLPAVLGGIALRNGHSD